VRDLMRDAAGAGRAFDVDRLVSLGNTLQLTGWARADRAVVDELAQHPTERAFTAACQILMGLWNAPADPAALATLVEVERRLEPTDPDGAHAFRVAVTKARKAE
jgi:hypothetical protein